MEAAPDEPAYAGAVAETRDALWELMVRYGDPYAGHRYGAGRYLKGYSKGELRKYLLKGNPSIGKEDPKGPRPPFRMPGWSGQMTEGETADLVEYLFSLFKPEGSGKT